MWSFETAKDSDSQKKPEKGLVRPGQGSHFHLRRVPALIKVGQGLGETPLVIPARVFVNDFKPDFLRIYASAPLQTATQVSVTIMDKPPIYINATVQWCKMFHLELNVIRRVRYDYRMQFVFFFYSEEEKQAIRKAATEFNNKLMVEGPENMVGKIIPFKDPFAEEEEEKPNIIGAAA